MNRIATTLTVAALSLGTGTVTALTTPLAAPTDTAQMSRQDASTAGIIIELVDQDFTIGVYDELRLVYRLRGDLGSAADLAPATTTTTSTSTTSTSTSSTTTVAPAIGAEPAAPDTAAPVDDGTPTTTTTTTVPPPRSITVDIANFSPITDIDQAARLLGATAQPGSFRNNVDGVRLADARSSIAIIDDSSALLTVSIPTDVGGDDEVSGPDSLEFPTPGLYPIRLQLLVDDDLVGTHGTLVDRRPGPEDTQRPFAPVQFAIITAVERPVRDRAAESGASQPSEADALDEVVDIIVAADLIDPPLLASIPPGVLTDAATLAGASGDDGDAEAAAADLLVGDELAALSDIDLDVSSAVAAGLDAQYTQALRRGEDAVIAALSRTPTRLLRIVDHPISASGAQLLRTIGVQALLMTPDRYATMIGGELPDTDRLVNVALPDGATLPLLLTDPASNDFSTDAADAALDAATPTEWAIETIASVVLQHRSQGRTIRRTRVLALDGFRPPDPRLINAFDAMAATTPDVTLIAPTALIGTTDTQRAPEGVALVLPEVAGPDLTVRLANIESAKLSLAGTASMIDDEDRFSSWTARLDALLSTGVADDEATDVISDITAESDAIRSSVALPEPFTFTLTGRSDTIPIKLRNTNGARIRVIVNLSSPTLTFPGNDRLIVLRPNDSTDIQVPVRARSNGTSPVTVQLLTPLGEPLGEPVSLTARVNSLTGLGQVLTGGFLLMLAAWWLANWRSRRRDDEETQETDHEEEAHQEH